MNDDSWLAMVALRDAALPSLEKIFAEIHRLASNMPPASEIRTSESAATCRWGEGVVGLTLVPRPIPGSLTEGPCANAWYWPNAQEIVHEHQAHLLINLVDESRDLVEKALKLTMLTSAVADAGNAVAVFWAPGGLIHEPKAFADQARQSDRSSLPLYLWIDFRVRSQADGRCDVFTTGMARFGKREIELSSLDAPPQQVLEWSYNLAHFAIDREAVIKDGDTMGLPDGTRFEVQHATSRIDGTTPVLALSRAESDG